MPKEDDRPVLVFDGLCNLCSGAVRFVIRYDRNEIIRFASLQSATGQKLAREYGLSERKIDSILLIKNNSAYIKSAAVLEIARCLPFPWPLVSALGCLPSKFLDLVYDFIARHRYRWFGKREKCLLPTRAIKAHFLD